MYLKYEYVSMVLPDIKRVNDIEEVVDRWKIFSCKSV